MSRWDNFRPEPQATPPRWQKPRQGPAQAARRPLKRLSPVWRTKQELLAVLEVYRGWYAQGLSDQEISHRIRTTWGEP